MFCSYVEINVVSVIMYRCNKIKRKKNIKDGK
jgi:hypothetical protein